MIYIIKSVKTSVTVYFFKPCIVINFSILEPYFHFSSTEINTILVLVPPQSFAALFEMANVAVVKGGYSQLWKSGL